MRFLKQEIKHLAISIGALAIAVSGIGPNMSSLSSVLTNLIIVSIPLTLAFAVHEIAHKAIANRYGYEAYFRMWPQGLLLALVIGIASSGSFIFAAPGAVMIQATSITSDENGKISLAGPLTNLGLATLFFPLIGAGKILGTLGSFGVMINLWLALFNLLPFPPLDGSKIFRWRPEISIPLLAITGFLLFFVF